MLPSDSTIIAAPPSGGADPDADRFCHVPESSTRFSIASRTARFSRADRSLAREWRFARTSTPDNLNEDPLPVRAIERDMIPFLPLMPGLPFRDPDRRNAEVPEGDNPEMCGKQPVPVENSTSLSQST